MRWLVVNQREELIRLWFQMWLQKKDLGILKLFTADAVYVESWGPKYHGNAEIKHWFDEWNTRGTVLSWEIDQFFHKQNQTVVEWQFKCKMKNSEVTEFDGISLLKWTKDNRVQFLKEYSCKSDNYDPYQVAADSPQFRDEEVDWL